MRWIVQYVYYCLTMEICPRGRFIVMNFEIFVYSFCWSSHVYISLLFKNNPRGDNLCSGDPFFAKYRSIGREKELNMIRIISTEVMCLALFARTYREEMRTSSSPPSSSGDKLEKVRPRDVPNGVCRSHLPFPIRDSGEELKKLN